MTRRGWLLFALMSVIWGIPYMMIKVAVEGVPVPVLVFARTALGALVLLPLALRSGRLRAALRHWPAVVAFATADILVPWWLLSDAERRLSSSLSGLLIASVPIIAVVAARLIGDAERIGRRRGIGLAVGLAGVAVLAGPELRGDAWAVVEVLLTAIGYASAPVLVASTLRQVPALPMTALCLTFAALTSTGPAVLAWPDAMPSGQVLAALAGLGLICTAVAFLVFFALINEVGATRAMVFTYVNPAVAVTAGVVFLNEPLTLPIVAAFVLILGGSVLATSRTPAAETEPQPIPLTPTTPAAPATPPTQATRSAR